MPAGAAITVAALVLVASVVTGREEGRAPDRISNATIEPSGAVASEDLDLERLKRVKKEGEIQDLFADRFWNPGPAQAASTPTAAATKPAPPPAPSAPPLPFRYLGRLADGDKLTVFLEKNQEALSAAAGDTIESTYQVESIADSAVNFVYLPLGTKQVLSIPAQR